jgi:DNA helicase-2/ATP-dependent DNA helicase PcrA
MDAAHLEKLNDGQRAAVVHGIGLPEGRIGGPLLIIAGAGSGKTSTLAHRVAQLVISGADPRRILLMTFSRRAAAELGKRVERICTKVLGDKAGILTDALAWSGTFYGIGARLLRPGRRAAAQRRLSDPVHHPFRQGTGMALGFRA